MYTRIFQLQADILKSLAQARRLEIVNLVRDRELSVTEIYQMLDLPQANVSQHLMVLKENQILTTRKKGKQIFYRIQNKKVITIVDRLRELMVATYQDTDLADELTYQMNDLVPVTRDPVCQMRVSPKTAACVTKFGHTTYYFCATGCLERFKNNPERYV